MNVFDEVRSAVSQAQAAQRAVDDNVQAMAKPIAGRLRKGGVDRWTLRALKRELRKYNPHTDVWAD